MPASELPEAEQPEAEVPESGEPLQPDPQLENESEVAGESPAEPASAPAEPEAAPAPEAASLAAPTLDEMSAGTPVAADAAPEEASLAAEAAADETPLPAQRPQIAVVAAGLLLIGLGIMLIWPALSGGFILVPGLIVLIMSLGVTLTLLLYWHENAHRARGALFLGLLSLIWGPLTSVLLLAPDLGGLARLWPFYAAGLGIVALLTALGERPADPRLIATGLVAVAIGGATVAVTWNLIQTDTLDTVRQVGPWLLVILALGLLPLVIRRARSSGSSKLSS